MMRILIGVCLGIATLAACSRPPSFIEYREPGGAFVVQAPSQWHLDERGPFSRRPVGEVWWIGNVGEYEDWPFGAVISVRRLDKNPDKRNKNYIKWDLADTQALFAGRQLQGLKVTKASLLGFDAREFEREYEEFFGGGCFGKLRSRPTRAEGVVIDTPDAYYVLEYRTKRELFEKYRYGFAMMKGSFRLKGT